MEAALKLVRAGPRARMELTNSRNRGSAAQFHIPSSEGHLNHETRCWNDAPSAVGCDGEIPRVSLELKTVGANADHLGSRARVVESQLAGCAVHLARQPIREDPAEWQAEARHDDVHRERRASGSL